MDWRRRRVVPGKSQATHGRTGGKGRHHRVGKPRRCAHPAGLHEETHTSSWPGGVAGLRRLAIFDIEVERGLDSRSILLFRRPSTVQNHWRSHGRTTEIGCTLSAPHAIFIELTL